MVYKTHFIELYINGQKADLESQNSLNLRFQNILFNPERIASTQADYSYEFELPSTPVNDKIFDYANNLSKLGKFRSRLDAQVIADGEIIFEGTITLNGYKGKKYQVNLVSIKKYSLDDIFGESVLTDMDWYKPFSGITSINEYNQNADKDVMFPLVSYGVFEKDPYNSDSIGNDYTSKYDLDEWNKWYVESFYPSLSMVETLRKCFEYKGYTVGGDAMNDAILKSIYMSTNLAEGQSPDYNVGNECIGSIDISTSWSTPSSGTPLEPYSPFIQTLKFPYWRIGGNYDIKTQQVTGSSFNFNSIQLYDLLSAADGGSVTVNQASYMYEPNEHIIVVPADGFYKIELEVSAVLNQSTPFSALQYCRTSLYNYNIEEENVTIPVEFRTTMPFEIQLVRNYDENIELIKGRHTYFTKYGYPNEQTWYDLNNRISVETCFPHEKLGTSWIMGGFMADSISAWPTEANGLGVSNLTSRIYDPSLTGDSLFVYDSTLGYMYPDSAPLMMYDQAVSPAFIMGFTSMGNDNGGGCAAVMKDKYSWSKTSSIKNDAYYKDDGYVRATTLFPGDFNWGDITYSATTYHENDYIDAPYAEFEEILNGITGKICCMVYLNKNDILQLFGVQRSYTDSNGYEQVYAVSANANLKISAASPKPRYELDREGFGYTSTTEFDTELRLSNFLNKEKKMSDFVQSVFDAFNLEMTQSGKNVFINKSRKFNAYIDYAVDIDDRVNSNEAEALAINYPSSMAVKYKIDTEEHGFYITVPPDKVELDNWKDYGDYGYDVIHLNDDKYETSTSDKNIQYSYTWYDNFNWYNVDSAHTKTSDTPVTLSLPVISKEEYMIEGYNYDESMKHDGYGLSQRFWFRPEATEQFVWTNTYPTEMVNLYIPTNTYQTTQAGSIYNINLSYKLNEISILTEYFNITPYLSSNYVQVEVYLSAEEYKAIKNGALIHFDDDIYIPVSIEGYDPAGFNKTEIKMLKRI